MISFDPAYIRYHEVVTIIQPYFEIFEIMLIIFLVHFQFQAFYNEPFLILEIISRKLHYFNITITIMSSSIFSSSYTYISNFTEIYNMIVLIALVFMIVFVYFQMHQINKLTDRRSLRQVLGFNVLYSVSLSLVVLELTNCIIVVSSFHNSLQTTTAERTLISTSLYFLLGFAGTFALQDVYMGMGVCYNLLGVFVLQTSNICQDTEEDCSLSVQVISIVYAGLIAALVGAILYLYPDALVYRISKRHRIDKERMLESRNDL